MKVTITVEQDSVVGETPAVLTWVDQTLAPGNNPGYIADAMQSAVVHAATGAVIYMADKVKYRATPSAIDAARDLLAALTGGRS